MRLPSIALTACVYAVIVVADDTADRVQVILNGDENYCCSQVPCGSSVPTSGGTCTSLPNSLMLVPASGGTRTQTYFITMPPTTSTTVYSSVSTTIYSSLHEYDYCHLCDDDNGGDITATVTAVTQAVVVTTPVCSVVVQFNQCVGEADEGAPDSGTAYLQHLVQHCHTSKPQ